MKNLEEEIFLKYDFVNVDASLPACIMYERRGYKTIKHGKCECNSGVILIYEIMEKRIK